MPDYDEQDQAEVYDETHLDDEGDGEFLLDEADSLLDVTQADGDADEEEFDEDDIDTVGGLLAKLVGRVPLVGASGEIDGLRLTAEKMAGRRHQLATLIVERVEPEDPTDPDGRGDERSAETRGEETDR